MLNFIKKQGVAFYLIVVAIILAIVGIITMLVSNSVQGYALPTLAPLLLATIFAIVLCVSGIFTSHKCSEHSVLTIALKITAVVLLTFAFGWMLLDRMVLITAQFSYDSVNTIGWGVLYASFTSMITFLVSAIAVVVSAFFTNKRGTSQEGVIHYTPA